MRVEQVRSSDIGLRHLLENGLNLAQGVEVQQDRREQVLQGLLAIFSEANRGSTAFGTRRLTPLLNEKKAVERFSTFYHHLRHEFGEQVPAQLGEAKAALDELLNGETSVERRENLALVLRALLESMRRDRALAPPRIPARIASR
jgi:hypothetical protein